MPTPWPQPEPENVNDSAAVGGGVGGGGGWQAAATATTSPRSARSERRRVRDDTRRSEECRREEVTSEGSVAPAGPLERGAPGGAVCKAGVVRVATFNTRHGAHEGSGLRSLFTDVGGLRSSVTSLHSDIVALQEVDRRLVRSWFGDQAALLGSATGSTTALFGPARRVLVTGHDGVALLVRGTLLSTRTLRLPGNAAPRVAVLARARVGDDEVTVAVTHLQSRVRSGPAEAPMQLDALLEELSRWPEPWILAGDLNLRPPVVVPALAAAGLTPLRAGPTYPASEPRIEIDFVAVRGLAPVTPGPGARTLHLPVSDHRALVAEVGAS